MNNLVTIVSGSLISLAMEFMAPFILFSSHSVVQTFLFGDAVKAYGRVATFKKPRRSRTQFRRV